MNPWQAILLGTVQGLTEFLPVSSSGHLVLFQNLFGMKEPELLFDICLHIGTLAAVCAVFFREIRDLLCTLLRLPFLVRASGGIRPLLMENETVRLMGLIGIGSIPTAILGLLFHRVADRLFGAVWIVGVMLLVTGTVLWVTRRLPAGGRALQRMRTRDALTIGLIQGIAIIPGISRSGSTISGALLLGIDRQTAGRYSFLLSIPAILGALVVGLDPTAMQTSAPVSATLLGTLTAGIVGFLALRGLLRVVDRGRLHLFAPYCWLMGLTALFGGVF